MRADPLAGATRQLAGHKFGSKRRRLREVEQPCKLVPDHLLLRGAQESERTSGRTDELASLNWRFSSPITFVTLYGRRTSAAFEPPGTHSVVLFKCPQRFSLKSNFLSLSSNVNVKIRIARRRWRLQIETNCSFTRLAGQVSTYPRNCSSAFVSSPAPDCCGDCTWCRSW